MGKKHGRHAWRCRSNDNRVLGLLGIVLNRLSVEAGLAILAAMAPTIGAFT
ncbi:MULTISPECIES: hypothetical protein [unclassified Mesorhizobium]|uniref:hypothetical protein n=1 Tax=unclassified Mesorhizobium TaxID=325217 RepID=UPI0015CE5C9E|nr:MULTISPECIES: hypothetical protein [unclassified Mesorhizobium]